MSLEKRLKQIYEDMDARIGQFSSITAWVNELKRQYISELGVVAEEIVAIFDEEIEEQRIQGVDKDVLFAWNVIKKKVKARLVEE